MQEVEVVSTLTQFGMAGLVAWMWLTERRGSALREGQLTEAHERLLDQRVQLDALLNVVSENTRAVSALEVGQRSLSRLVERVADGPAMRSAPSADPREAETSPAPGESVRLTR